MADTKQHVQAFWCDEIEAHQDYECEVLQMRLNNKERVTKRKGIQRGEYVVFTGGISKILARKCDSCVWH